MKVNERHSDQGRKARALKLWERLTWPQVGALALTLAGLIGVAHTLPQSFWDRVDWETVGWFVMSLLGVGGSAAAGPLLRRDPESHERSGDE